MRVFFLAVFTQLCILLNLNDGFAQTNNNLGLTSMAPPSPNAKQFTIYGEYPVSNNTGVPDISVPLYKISLGQLEIPISLRYHIDAAKPGKCQSNVGFGWTLDAGGIITRQINNLPDERLLQPASWRKANTLNQNVRSDFEYLYNIYSNGTDGAHDIFNYSFLDNSGGFVIDKQPNAAFKAYDFPHKPYVFNVVTASNQITTINITDDNGNVFEFGGGNNEYYIPFTGNNGGNTGWYLKSITTADQKRVDFIYSDNFDVYSRSEENFTSVEDYPTSSDMYAWSGYSSSYNGHLSSINEARHSIKILKEIHFPEGKVVFNTLNNGTAHYAMPTITKGFTVLNNQGAVTDEIQFEQDAFDNEHNYVRLKSVGFLNRSSEVIEKYAFNYNPNLIDNDMSVDFWGNYNNIQHGLPYKRTFNYKPDFLGYNTQDITFGDNNRQVDPIAQKAQVLEKITYPTGGNTTFTWESNKYQGDMSVDGCTSCLGGGLRIKQIVNSENSNSNKEFGYVDGLLAKSPFEISNVRNVSWRVNLKYDYVGGAPGWSYLITRNRTYWSHVNPELNETVKYNAVTVYEGSALANNGKKEYSYAYGNPNIYSVQYGAQYNYGNEPVAVLGTLAGWGNGLLSQVITRDKDNNIREKENYEYAFTTDTVFENLEVAYTSSYSIVEAASSGLGGDGLNDYDTRQQAISTFSNPQFPSVYGYHVTSIPTGGYNLTKKEVSTFDKNNQEVKTSTAYYYDDGAFKYPSRIESNFGNRSLVVRPKHPYHLSDAVSLLMVSKNMLSPVVEEKSYQSLSGTETLLSTVQTGYRQSGNLIVKDYIKASTSSLTPEPRVLFNQYDASGNITEQQMADGVKESYLWGYHNAHPVAKIVNAPYNTAIQYVNQSILDNPSSDQQLRTELNNLRVNLPGAQVSTFTYQPLVGMTSQTDAKGMITYYEYDSFQRLKAVKNQNGEILKTYCYNYAGQQTDCNSSAGGTTQTPPSLVYARVEMENSATNPTGDGSSTDADIYIALYSDANCTQPVSLPQSLDVNMRTSSSSYENNVYAGLNWTDTYTVPANTNRLYLGRFTTDWWYSYYDPYYEQIINSYYYYYQIEDNGMNTYIPAATY